MTLAGSDRPGAEGTSRDKVAPTGEPLWGEAAGRAQHEAYMNYHSKHVFGSHMHELVHEHKPGGTTPSRRTIVNGDHKKTHDGMRSGTLWVREILPFTSRYAAMH